MPSVRIPGLNFPRDKSNNSILTEDSFDQFAFAIAQYTVYVVNYAQDIWMHYHVDQHLIVLRNNDSIINVYFWPLCRYLYCYLWLKQFCLIEFLSCLSYSQLISLLVVFKCQRNFTFQNFMQGQMVQERNVVSLSLNGEPR